MEALNVIKNGLFRLQFHHNFNAIETTATMGVSGTLILHRCATVTEGMNYRWTVKLVEVSEDIVIGFITVTLHSWTIWVLLPLSTQYDINIATTVKCVHYRFRSCMVTYMGLLGHADQIN